MATTLGLFLFSFTSFLVLLIPLFNCTLYCVVGFSLELSLLVDSRLVLPPVVYLDYTRAS